MRAPGDTDDAYGFGNGTPSYSYTPQQPQQAAPQPTGGVGFQPQPGGYGGGGWESTSGSMDGGGGPPEPSEGMRKRNLSASWKLSQTLLGEGEEDEPPILEELGINFSHIVSKTRAVLWPRRSKLDQEVIDDSDFAGPLIFCFALAAVLLLKGKVQFSYIYVVFVTGLLALWAVLNLMSMKGIDIYRTASVLGYCLLPIVLLAALSLPLDLTGAWGALFVPLTVFWCSNAAALFFVIILQADDQRWLLLYPVMLFYTGFALITIF